MVKVVKIYLISEQTDKQGNVIDYKDIFKCLWDLQRETREIKNKAVQLCWEWSGYSSEYNRVHGIYPKEKEVLNYTLGGFLYDNLKNGYNLYSGNLSSTLQLVEKAYKASKLDFMRGDKSILSYKANQPLDIHKKAMRLEKTGNEFLLYLSILNKAGIQKYGIDSAFKFKLIIKDNATLSIVERCVDGTYQIATSKLIYDKKKKMWCINLSYNSECKHNEGVDKNRILGIDIGVACPLVASVYDDWDRCTILGGEIEEFRRRVEARKKSISKQTKYCGDGRIGHGINKRTEAVNKIGDKIACFRNTANHKYSRTVVDFAVKKQCGTIQMEDLQGITDETDRFLKNWPYYDLQTKIENKAKEEGIKVVYISPQYTSQRCSKCGYISKENRPEQAKFECKECGFKENADYNASQNIAIKNIDKIIEKDMSKDGAKGK